jgi:hypothetical protein
MGMGLKLKSLCKGKKCIDDLLSITSLTATSTKFLNQAYGKFTMESLRTWRNGFLAVHFKVLTFSHFNSSETHLSGERFESVNPPLSRNQGLCPVDNKLVN